MYLCVKKVTFPLFPRPIFLFYFYPMKRSLFALFTIVSLSVFSQNVYFIKDKSSLDAIPFVKVKPNIGNPFLVDIDGMMKLDAAVQSIELRASGYKDTIVQVSEIMENTIYLVSMIKEIQEVKVVAGENPAHRIIDLAIENRKKNNPLDNDAFRYESYSKFIFDANQEALDAIPENTTDSTLKNIKQFFKEQHIFMLESASTRTFIPPSRDKEEITAYKVSGFTDPMFSTFANEMQSFSFYENQFQLLGKTYINPIAFGGTRRYLFILEDTTIVNQDTTFMIFYRPRKGKNFDGMTGHLYINTNGYAIEKVTAAPYEDTTGTAIQIIQEYALIDGKKWFPSKLSTEIAFKSLVLIPKWKNGHLVGKGNTYIKNVTLNPEGLRKGDFNNVTVTTNENASEVEKEQWDSLRVYEITEKEERTYTMIDSLSKAEKLDEKLTLLTTLLSGKIPMGILNLDLTRLVNFNQYEGYRFGAGLETSKKLMKNVVIGGYYGWATRDKDSKYGGYSTIHFNRKNGIKLNLRYQQDLLERGGYAFQKDAFTLNSTSLYRHFFIQNMERQRLGEIAFSGNIKSNMKLTLIGNYQRIWTTDGYFYSPPGDFVMSIPKNEFDLAETAVELTWNIREKVMQLGDQRVSKGTKFPKIMIKATRGWKGWFESDLDYLRFNAEIQQTIAVRGIGEIVWTLTGAQTNGDVPLFLMQVGCGTGRNWNLSVSNTFETMGASEFYHSKQAALFTRFNFNSIKTKATWNEPQFSLHHAIGYGEMNEMPLGSAHSVSFKTMDKGFFETGLVLNSLFSNEFTGVGIAAFYRYGSYASTDWKKNIVPKFTVTFNL